MLKKVLPKSKSSNDAFYRSVILTRRTIAYCLNLIIKLGFFGLTVAIAIYFLPYNVKKLFDADGKALTIVPFALLLIVCPMIPLVIFCLPKCAKCGEKFNYPKYTKDPDDCKKCGLQIVKREIDPNEIYYER